MNSQLAVSVSDQSMTPVPEFQMSSTWCGGTAPPCVAVKVKLAGLCAMSGMVAVGVGVGESVAVAVGNVVAVAGTVAVGVAVGGTTVEVGVGLAEA